MPDVSLHTCVRHYVKGTFVGSNRAIIAFAPLTPQTLSMKVRLALGEPSH